MSSLETLRVIHFDRNRRVLHIAAYQGRADRVTLPIRAIISDALHFHSDAVLLSHNHPSGDPRPSRADVAATRLLAAVMRPFDIRLHDHIVTGGPIHMSFRAMGLL